MPTIAHEECLRVAVGIVSDQNDRVLVAQRPAETYQGNKWEFPGGKMELGETPADALRRELHEELGIRVTAAHPLVSISHDYTERSVLLHVWRVTRFTGTPVSRVHQNTQWVRPEDLQAMDLLAANRSIVQAIRLPSLYLITAASRYGSESTLERLEEALQAGVRLVQVREKALDRASYLSYANEVIALSHRYGAEVLLNTDVHTCRQTSADGIHLDSSHLMQCTLRPLPERMWVGASCHDESELRQAARIADFVVLGPVLPTASHPGATPLSWGRFAELVLGATVPVFAIGGMRPQHLGQARSAGAQGVAMISAIWEAPSITQAVADTVHGQA